MDAAILNVKDPTTGDWIAIPAIKGDKGEPGAEQDAIDTGKQDKTDNALNTTDKTVVGAINEVNAEIDEIKEQQPNLFPEAVQTGNLVDISMMHDGGRVRSDGTIDTTFASGSYSDFIDISYARGTYLAIYAMHSSFIHYTTEVEYLNYAQTLYRMCFYNDAKTRISYVEVNGGKISDGTTINADIKARSIVAIPDNAKFVRISFTSAATTSGINKYVIYRGNDFTVLPNYTEYVPIRETVVVPEDLNEQLDYVRDSKIYSHQDDAGNSYFTLRNSATFSENGITFVGNELWMMKDDASYRGGEGGTRIFRHQVENDEITYLGYIESDWGVPTERGYMHFNTMDYCAANDCFIYGNGAGDETTTGNFFVIIKNPLSIPLDTDFELSTLIQSGQAVKYDLDSTIGSVGFKVQALWCGSNLGQNNLVALLTNNGTKLTKVLLTKTNGEFDGGLIQIEQVSLPIWGIQDCDIFGDTLYLGGTQSEGGSSNVYAAVKAISLSDYSEKVIKRKFYADDGSSLGGCVQGIYVDAKNVWLCINTSNPQTKASAVCLTRYAAGGFISSGGNYDDGNGVSY